MDKRRRITVDSDISELSCWQLGRRDAIADLKELYPSVKSMFDNLRDTNPDLHVLSNSKNSRHLFGSNGLPQ
jgi:hypothetical protein